MFNRLIKHIFFLIIVRPLVLIIIGLNVRNQNNLPIKGPAIIVANHNSHLDTMVLMSLFPYSLLNHLRPVAAADYFLRNKLIAWFSQNIIGIIPIKRKLHKDKDPFIHVSQALEAGDIIILYPEGTRGEPEKISSFKKGVSHLAKKHPNVPVVPIFLHGLGKSLPKGETLLVPFFCDVFIGEVVYWRENHQVFIETLQSQIQSLSTQTNLAQWL